MTRAVQYDLASALRRLVDRSPGGKDYAGPEAHVEATREAIVTLGRHDHEQQILTDTRRPGDHQVTVNDAVLYVGNRMECLVRGQQYADCTIEPLPVMSEHWRQAGNGGQGIYNSDRPIADAHHGEFARRIVACHNALRDVPTQMLEQVDDRADLVEVLAKTAPDHKPFKTWLITDMHEGSEPTEHAFRTAIERDAFLEGIFVALNDAYAVVAGPDWVLDADLMPIRKPAPDPEDDGGMRP